MAWIMNIEVWTTITGLLCVYLNARENIWGFPIALINVSIFFIMFYQVHLYADMGLQVFFFILSVIGWYFWLTGDKNSKDVRVTRNMTKNETIITIGTILVGGMLWAFLLDKFTDASIPYLDATLAVASIIAQYFLSRKVLQNWLIWIFINVFSIGMYWYKELYMTSGLYLLFLGIATWGYFSWKQEMGKVTLAA
ncbi:nicotinamide mononucleotide transporter [Marininema mesophilum]|uniref:Nicotinamide mononucleotide transporter n=1 Tax=Marininema mesophilum TaxID=1048340 RepID=A0A1H2R7H1_9BACL|nr:nicotinamide riboside transporter PnuC [Marininema mesophilum]SDW15080.1 nicotinamide mononucleotide transporter [Marininema mesophilum]